MAIDDYSTPERHQGASRLMQQHGHLHLGTTLRTHHVVPIPCHGIRCMQCCGVRQHGVPCSAVLCGATLWYAVQCGAVRCLAMLCRTVQCGAAVWCGRASLSRASSGQAKLSQARLGSARLEPSRADPSRPKLARPSAAVLMPCNRMCPTSWREQCRQGASHPVHATCLRKIPLDPAVHVCVFVYVCKFAHAHAHLHVPMCVHMCGHACICVWTPTGELRASCTRPRLCRRSADLRVVPARIR